MLHFPFDKIELGSTIGDINATLYNNPVQVDGIQGKALSFNGINQYADFGDQTYVLFTWFYPISFTHMKLFETCFISRPAFILCLYPTKLNVIKILKL